MRLLLGAGVLVGVFVGNGVFVTVGVLVGSGVLVTVGVLVGSGVFVTVGVSVGGAGVSVFVGVAVGPDGVGVLAGVGVGFVPPQDESLNEPMRVCQGAVLVLGMYSVVNQNVQSSTGSIVIIE